MDLIYCAGGNTRLARIAIDEGFLYGARSDDIRELRCDGLVDIDWRRYDWRRHLNAITLHRPRYAVAPDVLSLREVPRVLRLAQQIADCSARPVIVPKVPGVVRYIPREFLVGVSVPTTYAGFLPPIAELVGREVHLLGGSPRQQRELWLHYCTEGVNVVSADANCHSKASDFGSYWDGKQWCDRDRGWIGKYEAFRRSCQGIVRMWTALGAI